MAGISGVIPAAGRGERFGRSENKAFAPLDGAPILAWTLAALEASPCINEIIVVTQRCDLDRAWRLAVEYGFKKLSRVVEGGADRQTSVLNGMAAISPAASVVIVHDAARPLTPIDVFERCAAAAFDHGSATAALPVVDTLRQGAMGAAAGALMDRSKLVRIQTPQAVRADLLRASFDECRKIAHECTDDSMMIERAADTPAILVPGSELSSKITRPEDLLIAESLVRQGAGVRPGAADGAHGAASAQAMARAAAGSIRIGMGYDVHSFDPARPMILAGVSIPDSPGLSGHSDADAALHAVCDAILGALGGRDIGYHFPNTDPAFKGADSGRLLEKVVQIAAESGWRPAQIDLTIVAEQPRLNPHVAAMRERLGALTGIDPGRVAIKATTNERMGFIGRGEGIAAFALAMLAAEPPETTQLKSGGSDAVMVAGP
ncbi:MAG TPA: 2-C-methyl-D-erythritol 4-phosphate cytidylyltransferase [Armatimonadota bacterium]|nr:2-C-methyl-D-erythritol 4-phosphate cytidylyltransferase [Armatimonadota bacterium]